MRNLGTIGVANQFSGAQIAWLFSHLQYLSCFEQTSVSEDENAFEEDSGQTMSDVLQSLKNPFPFRWPETIEERDKRYQSRIAGCLEEKLIAVVAEPIDRQFCFLINYLITFILSLKVEATKCENIFILEYLHNISYSMILSAQTADSFGQKKERLDQPLNDGPGEMPFLNDKEEALFRYFAIFRLGNVIATDCLQKIKDAHHSDNDESSSLRQVKKHKLNILKEVGISDLI